MASHGQEFEIETGQKNLETRSLAGFLVLPTFMLEIFLIFFELRRSLIQVRPYLCPIINPFH
jgi:hypothetical protein